MCQIRLRRYSTNSEGDQCFGVCLKSSMSRTHVCLQPSSLTLITSKPHDLLVNGLDFLTEPNLAIVNLGLHLLHARDDLGPGSSVVRHPNASLSCASLPGHVLQIGWNLLL